MARLMLHASAPRSGQGASMPFKRLATGVIATCCVASSGCAERNAPPDPSEASDDSNDGGVARGDLFVNVCRTVDDSLVCSPFRIAITSGTSPQTETQPLPQV